MKNIVLAILTMFIAGCACTQKQYNEDDNKKSLKTNCRIGMTTCPKRRHEKLVSDHKEQGKKVTSWTILSKHFLRSSAQKMETKEAKRQNCVSSPGGRNPEKCRLWQWWSVYKLEYENQ